MHQLGELGALDVVAWSGEAQAKVWCLLVCGSAWGLRVRRVTGFRMWKRGTRMTAAVEEFTGGCGQTA